jgi:hypothetical protein
MRVPKRTINIELLLGISATFLSLAALVVSIFQTKIAREQQQASVWPRLALVTKVLDRNFTYSVVNQGIGPAIIKSTNVAYKGKQYASLESLMFQLTGPLNGGHYEQNIDTDYVIKAEEEVELFMLIKNNERLSDKLRDAVNDSSFHFRIRYTDVYGNCWEVDHNKTASLGKCDN